MSYNEEGYYYEEEEEVESYGGYDDYGDYGEAEDSEDKSEKKSEKDKGKKSERNPETRMGSGANTSSNSAKQRPIAKKKLKDKAREVGKKAADSVKKEVKMALAKIFSNPYAWLVLGIIILVIAVFVACFVIAQKTGITLDAEEVILDNLQQGADSLE